MAKTPLTLPLNSASNSPGDVAWTDPQNAEILDANAATAALTPSKITERLDVDDFDVVIPPDATIDGVEVEVNWRGSPQIIQQHTIVINTGTDSTNKSTGADLPTSNAATTFGGATDKWGLTLTPAGINSISVGVKVQSDGSTTSTAYVNAIRIRVYWTPGPASGTLELQVAASTDDAEEAENSTGFSYTGPRVTHRFGAGTVSTRIGWRFPNIAIRRDHFIDSAIFTGYLHSGSAIDGTLKVQASSAPPDFATDQDVATRPLEATGAVWLASGLSAGEVSSPDMSTVLQQTIDRCDWNYDDAMVLVLAPTTTGTDTTSTFRAYDNTPANAGKLTINWSDQSTHVYRLTHGADDSSEKSSGQIDSFNELVCWDLGYVGLRFQDVKKPAGATLKSAILSVARRTGGFNGTELQVDVYGDPAAESANFRSDARISTRSKTTAIVSPWSATLTNEDRVDSPELKTLVNEMMDVTWVEGFPLTFLLKVADKSYDADVELHSFETGAANCKEPTLTLVWEIPQTVTSQPVSIVTSGSPSQFPLHVFANPAAVATQRAPASIDIQSIATQPPIGTSVDSTVSTIAAGTDIAIESQTLVLGGLPATTVAEITVSPIAAPEVLTQPPSLLAIETTLLQTPVALVVDSSVAAIAAETNLSSRPVAVAIISSPAITEPGVSVSPIAAVEVLAPLPSATAVDLIAKQSPAAIVIDSAVATIAAGIDVAIEPAAIVAVGSPSGIEPGATVVAGVAAEVLAHAPSVATVETTALSSPVALVIDLPVATIDAGTDVTVDPVAIVGAGSASGIEPGATVVADVAAEVLAHAQIVAAVETTALSSPVALAIDLQGAAIGAGADVAIEPTAIVAAGSPSVIEPGASVAASVVAGVLAHAPSVAAVDTTALSSPVALAIDLPVATIDAGTDVASNPVATTIACVSAIVSPGASVDCAPVAVAIGMLPANASLDIVARLSPVAIANTPHAATAGLGHDVAASPAALVMSSIDGATGSPLVASSPVGMVVSDVAGSVDSGGVVQPNSVAIASCVAPATIEISGEIRAEPASVTMAIASASFVGGVSIDLTPVGSVVTIVPPSGIGSVHIAGPDLFFTLPESRLHYTLFADRLHYTLPQE
jgi:hypothetical protein